MSALFERMDRLYRAGHAADVPELVTDQRLDGSVTDFRQAAVLAAFTDRADEPGLLLLHRPSNMRSHPGQIALPGGRVDSGETSIAAALREAHEELGIHERDVRVIGESDPYRAQSGFDIMPVIGVIPADLQIVPNPTEVAQWFEAPAAFLLDPANHERHYMDCDGRMCAYYRIAWQGHEIWGITAAIIVNLSRRLRWNG